MTPCWGNAFLFRSSQKLPRLCLVHCFLDCKESRAPSGVPHKASQGPLKGAVSAQKAPQGSEMEMRELLGGTEEKIISPTRGH